MDAFTPESVQRFRQFLYTKDYDAIDLQDGGALPADNATADLGSRAVNAPVSTSSEQIAVRGSSLDGKVARPEARDPIVKTILAHARMIEIGDYYHVPELVEFANARVSTALENESPDGPWVADLPYMAEAALDIVNNKSLIEALTTAVSENIDTIIAMGTLQDSPLVTPFSLEVLKKCSATSQALPGTLSYETQILDLGIRKYKGKKNVAPTSLGGGEYYSHVPKCGMYRPGPLLLLQRRRDQSAL